MPRRASSWRRSTAGSLRALTPPTCRRPGYYWRRWRKATHEHRGESLSTPNTGILLCPTQLWHHWHRRFPALPPRFLSPSSPLLAHCREHAFWCKRQCCDMCPYGIGHRIGNGRSRSDDGWFTHPTCAVERVLCRDFDDDTFNIGNIQGTGDLVIQKTGIDIAAC